MPLPFFVRPLRALILFIVLVPALRDAPAGTTVTLGADNSSFVDPTNYTTPTVSSLIKDGTGLVALTGTNTYTDGTTIDAGTLQIGYGGSTGSIAGNVTDNAILSFNRSDAYAFNGVISGTGSVQQSGAGALTLSGHNTYSGQTLIDNQGTVIMGSASALGAANGSLAFGAGSGTLDLNGYNLTLGSLSSGSTNSVITNNAAATTSTVTISQGASGFQGNIVDGSGIVALVNGDFNFLQLKGNNTYSGGTSVTGGYLVAGSSTAFGTGALSVTDGTVDLDGHNITVGSLDSGGTTLGYITNNTLATATLTTSSSNNSTFGGKLVDGAPGTHSLALSKSGTGTLILTGDNTYQGGTTINSGTLQLGNGGTSGFIIGNVIDNATLAFDRLYTVTLPGVISGSGSVQQLGSGTIILSGTNTYTGGTVISAGTLQIGAGGNGGSIVGDVVENGVLAFNHSDAVTFGGVISGTGQLQQNGSGSLTLSGANTYSGGTAIGEGMLNITDASALGSGPLTVGPTVQTSAARFNNYSGHALTLTGNNPLILNGHVIIGGGDFNLGTGGIVLGNGGILESDTNLTVGGVVSGSATFRVQGGPVTLTNDNTYTGGTVIGSLGSMTLGNGGTTGSILGDVTLAVGTLIFNRSDDFSYDANISGFGDVNKSGANTLTLTGANTYTGTTSVSAGKLIAGSATAFGMNGTLVARHTGILDLNGYSQTVDGFDSDNGGIITNSGVTDVTITANIAAGAIFNGMLNDGSTHSIALIKNGVGDLTLSGANTYSGGTVLNGGSLRFGNANALGTGPLTVTGASTLYNVSAGALTLSGNVINLQADITFLGLHDLNLGTGDVHLSGNRTITLFADVLTVGGVVSGAGSLTKSGGGGTLVLSTDNTYTGGTIVTNGTLQIGNGGATGSIIGNVALTNVNSISPPSVLAFNRNNDLVYDGVISGVGSVQQNGAGKVILTGANTYTGGTTINAGILQIGNGGTSGSVAGNIIDKAALTFDRSDTLFYSGNISGTGSLDQLGTGTLVLTGANTYTGGTTVHVGTLQIGTSGLLGGGMTGSLAGNVTLDHGNLAFNRNNALTFAGDVSGTGSLIKNGNGTTTLTGTTSVDDITINNGTLQVGNGGTTGSINTTADSIVNNGTIAFNRSDTVTYAVAISGSGELQQIGSGTVILTGGNTYSGTTTITAGTLQVDAASFGSASVVDNATFAIFADHDVNLGSALSGTGKLVKVGTGFLGLQGMNTYTGGTEINAGTISLGSSQSLGAITGSLAVNNGRLDLEGFSLTVGALTGNSANGLIYNVGLAPSTLTINGDSSGSYAGRIMDITSTVALVKNGTGALTLSGANDFSGGMTLNAGTLNLNSSTALGAGMFTINGGTIDNTSGANVTFTTNNVQTWNSDITFLGTDSLNLGTGTVSINATRTVTVNNNTMTIGGISGTKSSYGLIKNGSGTLVLTGNDTFTGTLMINDGILQIGDGSLATTKITDKSILEFNQTADTSFDAKIKGSGQLWQVGTNVLTLTQANSYTGGTEVDSGTLRLGRSKALSASAELQVNSTGTLDLNGFDLKVRTLSSTGGGTITSNGTASALLTTTSTEISTFDGAIIDGTSTVALTKAGSGTLILRGNSTYTGKTTIKAGTLQLDGTAGSIASGMVANSGKLVINRSNAFAYSGAISGKGSVLQNGSGTTTLSGTNSYTGGTIVNNGTLAVGSATALGKGDLFLNSGALETNGVLHQINVGGNLSWNSSAVIHLTLTPDATSEFVNVTGKLISLDGGQFTFDFTPVGLPPGDNNFTVMTAARGFGSLTGSDFVFISSDQNLHGTFSIVGNSLIFNDGYGESAPPPDSVAPGGGTGFAGPQPVPEPATWALLILGGAVLVFAKRRRICGSR